VYLFIVPSDSRPVFNSYALPQPRRREGPAAALSFLAHIAIAILVLWRGAALFEGGAAARATRRRGSGGGRGQLVRVASNLAHRRTTSRSHRSHGPTIAVPASEPVKIDVPPRPSSSLSAVGRGRSGGHHGGAGQGRLRGGRGTAREPASGRFGRWLGRQCE